jgi:predicted RNA-binding protein with PIN domain
MPVIVDGYNLMHVIQKSDEDFANLTEVGLCKIISEYLKRVRDRGHIVFDGTGPYDKTDMEWLGGIENLEVYFSGNDAEADEIIEQKILDSSAPKSLVVVSTDRRIRAAAKKRKATALRSEIFWLEIIRHMENQNKPTIEPKQKRQGLTEGETDQWLDYFGLDE